MVPLLLFALSVQNQTQPDTVTLAEVKAEYSSIFHVRAIPPDGPQTLFIGVRTEPEGEYLAAFQREHGFVLTFLIQHGLGFDLADVAGETGEWDQKILRAREALVQDETFEGLLGPILARFLGERGLHLEGYPIQLEREAIPLADVEQLAARYIFPDGLGPNGQIQVLICTNLNGASELPLGDDLLMGAFVFAAIRNNPDDILPEVERSVSLAQALVTAGDESTAVARAQGAIWTHLISSGVLRRVIRSEWARVGPYFPFEIVEG